MSNQLKQLLNKNIKLYVIATGAGSGLQKRLWEIPGCSSFLVGCCLPYDIKKTERIIGYKPEHFVSKEVAIELAMAAYMEAYNPNDNVDDVIGIGLTASVASLHPHKGDHRVIVAAISNTKCIVKSIVIQKGDASCRSTDGEMADDLGELAILEALDIPVEEYPRITLNSLSSLILSSTNELVSNQYLIDFIMERPFSKADGTRNTFNQEEIGKCIFYPGTFNPLHYGHIKCADATKKKFINYYAEEPTIIYSTCINPKHKPELSASDILQKISQMKGRNFLLTKDDALFLDKAKAFPGSCFIIGADTLLNLLDPKWGHDIKSLLKSFSDNYVSFYVIGREINDVFVALEDVEAKHPEIIRGEYNFIPVDGRWDISSTELRNKKNAV